MGITQSRIFIAAVVFFMIFLTGFLLRRSGKPYPGLLFNIHKLIGLAAVVLLGITIYQLNQQNSLHKIEIAATIVAFLFFVATIITGGLTSLQNPRPKAISVAHKLLPYLTTLSSAITLYFLFSRVQ